MTCYAFWVEMWFVFLSIVIPMIVGISGCASHQVPDKEGHRIERLSHQIEQLNRRVTELSRQLAEQRARTAEASLIHRTAVCQAPEPMRSVSAAVSVEVELRAAQRALARLIERLDLTPETRRELLQNLKPTRSLDTENPWMATK
jgi:outer membrane murein-binding lipoprotein Lpp